MLLKIDIADHMIDIVNYIIEYQHMQPSTPKKINLCRECDIQTGNQLVMKGVNN